MRILYLGLLCVFVQLPCAAFTQTDRYQIQSCLNLEYANVLVNAPSGLSNQDAYKRGYSQGFEFIPLYEKQLKSLPNPEVEVLEILKVASDAGYRMAKNLTKEQITLALEKCRSVSVPSTNVGVKKSNPPSDASLIARIKPIATTVNSVWTDTGVLGLTELTDLCYRAIRERSYDCLIVDAASMFINSIGPDPSYVEFFSAEAHNMRLAKTIDSGQFNVADLNRVNRVIREYVQQVLIDDLKNRKNGLVSSCIIVDPDISTRFTGECIDNYANGYGVARGRDEYRGDFKNGMTHGYGNYIFGMQSKWATEEYHGWYYKGTKTGYGVMSISSESNHPALESMKKYGKLRDGRYYVSALYRSGRIVKHCISEEECIKEIPTFNFYELDDLPKYGSNSVGLSDVERLTNMAIYRQSNLPAKVNDCITRELIAEFFGEKVNAKPLGSSLILNYQKFLGTKRLVTQAVLYCSE